VLDGRGMIEPKRIEDVSVQDLKNNRWCYYHNDELGFDCFEHVISDEHPEFDEHTLQLELVKFEFSNGAIQFGSFDGSESFVLMSEEGCLSFWFGIAIPDVFQIKHARGILQRFNLELPVIAKARHSGEIRTFNGLQYLNENGVKVEVTI
jgi:hypothetical protein